MSPIDTLLHQILYINRPRVKKDVEQLLKNFKSLLPKVGTFTHDNGADSKLLVLGGTIPVNIKGHDYNFPIEIFIPEDYPNDPPKIFLRPTANMTIKIGHPNVDSNGNVKMPYLSTWSQHSNLLEAVQLCSTIFAYESPLFAKSNVSNPPPVSSSHVNATTQNIQSFQSNHYANNSILNAYQVGMMNKSASINHVSTTPTNGSIYSAYPDLNRAQSVKGVAISSSTVPTKSLQGKVVSINKASDSLPNTAGRSASTATPSSSSSSMTHPSTVISTRHKLLDELSSKMYTDVQMMQLTLRDDFESECLNEEYLDKSHAAAMECVQELKNIIKVNEKFVEEVTTRSNELKEWESNQEKLEGMIEIEDRWIPFDDLTSQIVKLMSECYAIDDAYYYLERALLSAENKSMDLITFLKETRKLATKQFRLKAHLKKINSVMVQQEQTLASQRMQSQQQFIQRSQQQTIESNGGNPQPYVLPAYPIISTNGSIATTSGYVK